MIHKDILEALPSLGKLNDKEIGVLRRVRDNIVEDSSLYLTPYICNRLSNGVPGDYKERLGLRTKINEVLASVLPGVQSPTLGVYLKIVLGCDGLYYKGYKLINSLDNGTALRLAWIDKIIEEQNL